MFLPLHAISLTQPRDQAVVYTFKKLYQKLPSNVTFMTVNNPFHDFWKFYTIMHSIINIQAARAVIKEPTMAGVWGKMWPEFMHNSGGFEKPAVEHNVKETDYVEFMALEKQFGGKSLEDFLSDATMKLINSHSYACRRPGGADGNKHTKGEEDEPALVHMVTIYNMLKTGKMLEDSITFYT